MSNCIHTIFNPDAIDAGFSSVMGPILENCPGVLLPLAIPAGLIKRVLLTLQHIARARDVYSADQSIGISCGQKIGLWFVDIGCILFSPFLLLQDITTFAIDSVAVSIKKLQNNSTGEQL